MTTPDTTPEPQHLLLLGEIKGIVESLRTGQEDQAKRFDKRFDGIDGRIDGLDGRLRAVEVRSATYGAISGGVIGIGMALLVEGLKEWLRRSPGQ